MLRRAVHPGAPGVPGPGPAPWPFSAITTSSGRRGKRSSDDRAADHNGGSRLLWDRGESLTNAHRSPAARALSGGRRLADRRMELFQPMPVTGRLRRCRRRLSAYRTRTLSIVRKRTCGVVVVGMRQSSRFGPSFEPAAVPAQVPGHPADAAAAGSGRHRGGSRLGTRRRPSHRRRADVPDEREQLVLARVLLAQDQAIARELVVTLDTVKKHVGHVPGQARRGQPHRGRRPGTPASPHPLAARLCQSPVTRVSPALRGPGYPGTGRRFHRMCTFG